MGPTQPHLRHAILSRCSTPSLGPHSFQMPEHSRYCFSEDAGTALPQKADNSTQQLPTCPLHDSSRGSFWGQRARTSAPGSARANAQLSRPRTWLYCPPAAQKPARRAFLGVRDVRLQSVGASEHPPQSPRRGSVSELLAAAASHQPESRHGPLHVPLGSIARQGASLHRLPRPQGIAGPQRHPGLGARAPPTADPQSGRRARERLHRRARAPRRVRLHLRPEPAQQDPKPRAGPAGMEEHLRRTGQDLFLLPQAEVHRLLEDESVEENFTLPVNQWCPSVLLDTAYPQPGPSLDLQKQYEDVLGRFLALFVSELSRGSLGNAPPFSRSMGRPAC